MKKSYFISVMSLALLSGCSNHEDIYLWDKNYEPAVYQSLQGTDQGLDKNISSMNKTLDQASSQNKKLPPGFYAQLGLLYGKVANYSKMRDYLEKEKQLFPESREYMNFLLKKTNREKSLPIFMGRT